MDTNYEIFGDPNSQLLPNKMIPIPYQTVNWNNIETTIYPGKRGKATWRTLNYDGLRVRMVEYSPGYVADHWCEKGHILFCIKGELKTELADGSIHMLKSNMSCHVSDQKSRHKSSTDEGAILFIVDGEFLNR